MPKALESHGLTDELLDDHRRRADADHPRLHRGVGRPKSRARDRRGLPQGGALDRRATKPPKTVTDRCRRPARRSRRAALRVRSGRRAGRDRRRDRRGGDQRRRRSALDRSHDHGGQGRADPDRSARRGHAGIGPRGDQLRRGPAPPISGSRPASSTSTTSTSTSRPARFPRMDRRPASRSRPR